MNKTLLWITFFSIVLSFGWSEVAQAQSDPAPKEVDFYVVAHQDDWQLFMGSHAYNDVQKRSNKVVFVCLTAGQANNPGDQYWKGREAGCKAAARAAADVRTAPTTPTEAEDVVINTHPLQVFRYKNTSSYFLRLPDGGLDAKGFARGGFQSLAKCKAGQSSVSSIDGRTSYANWDDLVKTLQLLIQRETTPNSQVTVHYPDPKKNKTDHPDHTMAGVLAHAASSTVDCRQLLYLGYITQTKKINLTEIETAHQTLLFKTNCNELVANGLESTWDDKHRVWLGRQYFRRRNNDTKHPTSRPTPIVTSPPVAVIVPTMTPSPDSLAVGVVRQVSLLDTLATQLGAEGLVLHPNYPNPFDMASLISYQVPKNSFVSMRIFDLQGRLIQTLVQEKQVAGSYEVWVDVNQFPVAGVYVCLLQANGKSCTRRLQITH